MGPAVSSRPSRLESCLNGVDMRWFHSLHRRLRSFLEKNSSHARLSQEVQRHLERQTEANLGHGMSSAGSPVSRKR